MGGDGRGGGNYTTGTTGSIGAYSVSNEAPRGANSINALRRGWHSRRWCVGGLHNKPETMTQFETYTDTLSTMWRAETPSHGYVDEMFPPDAPTLFIMAPEDMISLIGHPNSKDEASKTTHAWDVTDGTKWVRVYNYKHPRAFSMRGDAPYATTSFLAFVTAKLK